MSLLDRWRQPRLTRAGLQQRQPRRRMPRIALPPPFRPHRETVVSANELAAHWHLPGAAQTTVAEWRANTYLPQKHTLTRGKLDEPPPPFSAVTPLDDRVIRVAYGRRADGTKVYLGIPMKSLRFHTQITATTGAGKSHLAKVMIGEVLRVDGGFGMLDFKGDTVDDLLLMIPRDREGSVVVIDPTDDEWPIGLNLLDRSSLHGVDTDTSVSLLESTIGGMDENWSSSVGMQQFLGWGGKALVTGAAAPTLAHLNTFLGSAAYRNQILPLVTDVQTKMWWERTFPDLPEQQKLSMVALQRRLDPFMMNGIVRRMCNQPTTTVPFRQLMDRRGIVLAKVPVDVIGAKEGAFLATLIVNLIVAAAFSRQAVPENEREIWVLAIDEFQEAVGRGDPQQFKSLLERLRSFGVAGLLMHQHTAQLPPDILAACLGIIQNRFILSARGPDAAVWARQYPAARLGAEDWNAIPVREEGYAEMSLNATPQGLCTFQPLPLWVLPADDLPPAQGTVWQDERAPVLTVADATMDERIAYLAAMDPAEALLVLQTASDADWTAYCTRTALHRVAQRAAILRDPACIPDKRTRILTLSRLGFARPIMEVDAALLRLALAFPRDVAEEPKRRGGRPKATVGPPDADGGSPDAVERVVAPQSPNKAGTFSTFETLDA